MVYALETPHERAAAAKYLEKDFYPNLNARNYLANVAGAKIYAYGGRAEHGVIVAGERVFLATRSAEFMADWWDAQPGGFYFFVGVPTDIAELFLRGKRAEFRSPCEVYALKGEPPVPDGRPCESLLPEDAEEVDLHYTYRHEGSLETLRGDIMSQESACVRIGGELAAWCMVHGDDGSLGPLYTKEKFRRQGLGERVSADVVRKQKARGRIPFAHIVEGNAPSLALAGKFAGMERTHSCIWFGVEKYGEL